MKSSRIMAAMCGVLVLMMAMAQAARADQIDDPRYKAWSSFKADSSQTLTTSMERSGMKVTMDVKTTLKEVTDDHVTLEIVRTMTINGQAHATPAVSQTINSKTDGDNVKEAGEEDVDAMGKTFKCKVYTYDKIDSAGPGGAEVHAKIWVSSDVPGGVVKMESAGGPPTADGKPGTTTLLLKDYEAK